MSATAQDIKSLGSANTFWGVCGFTSTFYSMYMLAPDRALAIGAGIASKVLAEIKTYLITLRGEGKTDLLQQIEKFTQSFGTVNGTDFGKFKIEDYIQLINSAVGKSDADIQKEPRYSIALPPQAVADYVRKIWGKQAEICMAQGNVRAGGNGIVGVKKTNGTMREYGGLCHWMYQHEQKIYSWGKSFDSVKDANTDYELCWLIKIT